MIMYIQCLNCSDASFYLPYMRLYYKPYAVNSVAVTCVSLDSSLISRCLDSRYHVMGSSGGVSIKCASEAVYNLLRILLVFNLIVLGWLSCRRYIRIVSLNDEHYKGKR